MSETMEIGNKLVELCRQGKFREATNSLYSPDIVSVEAFNPAGSPRVEGIKEVQKKGDWWEQNHEVHSVQVDGPWPHEDRFIVRFKMDVTPKTGPMAGKRMTMDEAGLYTVKNGKVTQEEFFYHMG